MADILRAENLSKQYKKVPAVRSVSFELRSGQIVGLLGPNGAGKTTTFYMMAGLVSPDEGRVYLNNIDITEAFMHNRVKLGLGYLPQGTSVFRQLSAEDNIRIALEARPRLSHEQIESKLEELIKRLHITDFRNTLGAALSGGECRRVEFARTLASAPKFILLDEPFVGMDPLLVADVQKIITELAKDDIGIVITDHNVRETLKVCDYAYIMKEGEIFASGTPEEVMADERVRASYLGQEFKMA